MSVLPPLHTVLLFTLVVHNHILFTLCGRTCRYCRRYWFLAATCDLLYVEEAEGDGIGLVGSVEELQAIMARLNKRGTR